MQQESTNQHYEKAAVLRDRLQALQKIYTQTHVTLKTPENLDIIGIAEKNNTYAIEVFFFRNGYNQGNRSFFPEQTTDRNFSEILESFLAQFYRTHPAPKKNMDLSSSWLRDKNL